MQRGAKVEVKQGHIGPQKDRLAIGDYGLVKFSLIVERTAEIGMSISNVRLVANSEAAGSD